jgi:predicted ATPase with chaperone activity
VANPIGELLVREGLIAASQLPQAVTHQKRNGGSLADNIVTLGFVKESELNHVLHPVPRTPLKVADTGLSEAFLTDLLLKAAYHEAGTFSIHQITKQLCLPFSVADELLELMKIDQLVAIRSATGYGRESQVFELMQRGRERAEAALNMSLYVGAAPVPLRDYTRILVQQYVGQVEVDSAWIRNALSHMVIGERLLDQLGPAFSSGRSIFLYGSPGTGKSSIAEALGRALPDEIYIPQAVEVSGQVIRLYDPAIHFSVENKSEGSVQLDLKSSLKHDPRWKKCRRPVVMVGGELTADMLDLRYDANSKFYEAPVHMKAGNGVFILDDFGRQKVAPRDLLNRWIVPLERGTDFLSLHTGMKFEIPFDQISIFCTNLRPEDLVDEAFLRRIRHKVKILYQTEDEYREILRRICEAQGIQYDAQVTEYLLDRYYRKEKRELVGSHPRDLVEQIMDRAHFIKQPPVLSIESVDAAASNYFVEL